MRIQKSAWVVLTVLLAGSSVGCSLSIEQILGIQEGSGIDMSLVGSNGEVPLDRLVLEGGTVMRIDVSTSLLDYLDGTVDGDVTVLDLLFAVPNFKFIVDTGPICIILDPESEAGGTFAYDVLQQEASFDIAINTLAIPENPAIGTILTGGVFRFPFDFQSSVPLTLLDAVGLASGTGRLEVTQEIDQVFPVSAFGGAATYNMHAVGAVTIESNDAFPVTPLILHCIERLEASTL